MVDPYYRFSRAVMKIIGSAFQATSTCSRLKDMLFKAFSADLETNLLYLANEDDANMYCYHSDLYCFHSAAAS